MSLEARLARYAGEAASRYKMISKGDKIMIAFSGGKDSYALLDMLCRFQKKSPIKFELLAVTIDSGFPMTNLKRASSYIESKGVKHIVEHTQISDVVKKQISPQKSSGKNCFMCSRLRRGILSKIAKREGCNKIALGHNLDDSISTLMLNMFYSSRLDALRPKYKAGDGLTIIRPLITTPERLLIDYSKEKRFPIVKQKCPLKDEDSRRLLMNKLSASIAKDSRFFYVSMGNVLGKLYPYEK